MMIEMMRALHSSRQQGFTLVEMIMVIVITGIIGGMVAIFIKVPVQGYMDSARRAEMTDIADTALRRIGRDIRTAVPNSVRVSPDGNYLEFIPTTGGGRYRAAAKSSGAFTTCGSYAADVLDFTAADICFEVLGPMPPAFTGGESVVVYNLGIAGASAYDNTSRTTTAVAQAGNTITIAAPGKLFPFDSPSHRFHIISTPVTYACNPVAATGSGGTLTRYWGYAIQDVQTKTDSIAELNALVNPPTATRGSALLATNVSTCSFTYDPLVSARNGLVTLNLGITESGSGELPETVTLYNAAHVSNTP